MKSNCTNIRIARTPSWEKEQEKKTLKLNILAYRIRQKVNFEHIKDLYKYSNECTKENVYSDEDMGTRTNVHIQRQNNV